MTINKMTGFTLIELVTVVTILSIMIFLALPNFNVWLQTRRSAPPGKPS